MNPWDNNRFDNPSTETAKFLKGTHRDGRLGARERQTNNGLMSYSKARREEAVSYGLPRSIRGNPLGCGCYVAHLYSASAVVNGTVEVDYQCDSGWHNYVVFQVRQYTADAENAVKIDRNGNLTTETGFQAGELQEM